MSSPKNIKEFTKETDCCRNKDIFERPFKKLSLCPEFLNTLGAFNARERGFSMVLFILSPIR